MTPEFAAFLGQFGLPITMLIAVLTTGARGIWVWGRELKAERAEKELARRDAKEWRVIALKALNVGERAVEVAQPDA